MGWKIDMVGRRFNRIVVVEEMPERCCGQVKWKCVCDCGKEFVSTGYALRNGKTLSCGCYADEIRGKASITHGMSNTKEYRRFNSMISRCYNPKNRSYDRYGAKGIIVSPLWLGDGGFENFIESVGMMPDYEQDWTLERIDFKGNYEPGNVKWILDEFQSRNKGKTVRNTSGVTGVTVAIGKNGVKRYRVYWMNLDGKAGSKSFSVLKYGEDEAFRLACEYRVKMIAELNEQGAGYGERHGT
jgi:hypothetical protein